MVNVFLEETGSRNGADTDFLCKVHAEVDIALVAELADICQYKVGSLGIGELDSQILETLREKVFHVGVVLLQADIVVVAKVKTDNGGFHQGSGSAYCQEVMDFLDPVDDAFARNDIAETPTRNGESL